MTSPLAGFHTFTVQTKSESVEDIYFSIAESLSSSCLHYIQSHAMLKENPNPFRYIKKEGSRFVAAM
jgi:hypothetical protein